MGGHGGLNILPQKRWNVYNYENREKVRRDEEAAAREEQLKREQSRKRDAEFRLEMLRRARGLPTAGQSTASAASEPKSNHINLFEGLEFFSPLGGEAEENDDPQRESSRKKKKQKQAAATPKVILPEDEKYRLGYGVAGKGVKAPWYMSRLSDNTDTEPSGASAPSGSRKQDGNDKPGKKTLEELREERLKREKREKERERALVLENSRRDGAITKAWAVT
uniref:CBF1-interacting co-repressor CIR N-terminal domain-containing protein n=1 Tax=Nelumbo nucifera TaxID=4432 RepID=A0A822XAU1_NELNU|nr:TPA_asm: hypothetical protein HUJ06_019997 [Nelumbo nucifera]